MGRRKKLLVIKRGPTHITGIDGWCQRSGFPLLAIPGKYETKAQRGLATTVLVGITIAITITTSSSSRDYDLRVGGAGCELDGRWTMHPSYEHHRRFVCVLFCVLLE